MKTAAEIAAKIEAAEAELARIAGAGTNDPAIARLGPKTLRQHHRSTDRDLQHCAALYALIESLGFDLARAEFREAEAARVRLTREQIVGAKAVRTRSRWHRVVRVNAKSVTVATAYSWTDRLTFDEILEVAT